VWKESETSTLDVRGGARAKVRTPERKRPKKKPEADWAFHSDQITEKTPIPPPDWEALIEVIAKEMIEERSPARILQVRAKLYDLLTHCIPATTILKVCALQHIDRTNNSLTCSFRLSLSSSCRRLMMSSKQTWSNGAPSTSTGSGMEV
jgi:hypothetical protein